MDLLVLEVAGTLLLHGVNLVLVSFLRLLFLFYLTYNFCVSGFLTSFLFCCSCFFGSLFLTSCFFDSCFFPSLLLYILFLCFFFFLSFVLYFLFPLQGAGILIPTTATMLHVCRPHRMCGQPTGTKTPVRVHCCTRFTR